MFWAVFCYVSVNLVAAHIPGGGLIGLIFAVYVPLASQNPYLIIVYSVGKYRPHLSHFWENVIFVIPVKTRSSWNRLKLVR